MAYSEKPILNRVGKLNYFIMKSPKVTTFLILFLFFTTAHGQIGLKIIQVVQTVQEPSNVQILNRLEQRYYDDFQRKKEYALQFAKQNGIPVYKENRDGSFSELMEITSEGKPIYYITHNINASIVSRANHLNTNGSLGLNINGQNMTAHIWDGGSTRATHQEYGSRIEIGDGVTTLNKNSSHANHITGTILATGIVPNAKGVAYQANAITYDWNNDLSEAIKAAKNGMLLSNHSYGYDPKYIDHWWFGAYTNTSRGWDELMYNAPYYLMVKAAGNNGNNSAYNILPLNKNSMCDKLDPSATVKNNLVVAATNTANINAVGDLMSVAIAKFSSQGPTDDLRIKPDIAGNGVGIYSTDANSDTSYKYMSGTSMAAANVTASLLLLQQHYKSLHFNPMKAATLKGLALHTADDAGAIGPDVVFGWGLLNTKKAAETISQIGKSSLIEENTLATGSSYSITVTSDGTNPLIASISWTDPPGTANTGTANLTTLVLVNDLDIRITKETTFEPYKLTSITSNATGDNTVDPYERIDINGATGTYTITVTHKGTLSSGLQDYSLVVTGVLNSSSDVAQSKKPATEVRDETTFSKNKMRVAPNPNNGIFKVFLDKTVSGKLKVTDLFGGIVFEKEFMNKKELNVNLHKIKKGVYIVSVISNNIKLTKKQLLRNNSK